jgi:Fe-Mn family superoxide dismutase
MTRVIERDYFSLSNLKSEFLAQAKAMFGPGFVWLVMRENKRGKQNYFGDDQRRLGILCTYGAGSPLSGAHFRAQKDKDRIQFPGGKATLTAERIAQNATLDAVPILCVSTWQHSYIRDFGVGGKERFLEAWWDSINWGVAEEKVRIDNIPQPTKRPNEEKGYLMKKLDLSTGM